MTNTVRFSGDTVTHFEDITPSSKPTGYIESKIGDFQNHIPKVHKVFKYCPFLIRVELTTRGILFDFDNLLDNCPVMTHLVLDTDSVILSQNSAIIYSSHGLLSLSICSAKVNPFLFNYVSQRCQKLSYLTLRDLRIQSVPLHSTEMIYIDLSHSNLQLLNMCSIDTIKPPAKPPTNEGKGRQGLIPRLALLAVTIINPNNKFALEHQQQLNNDVLEAQPTIADTTTLWFHKYHSKIKGVKSTPWEQLEESTDTKFREWKKSSLFTKTTSLQYYVELRCESTRKLVLGY